jgi:hypothetical protein
MGWGHIGNKRGDPWHGRPVRYVRSRASRHRHFYSLYGYCMGVPSPSCSKKVGHVDGTADSMKR